MAYPTKQSLTATTFSSDTTAHAVNMPATVDAGDLLLCLFVNNAVGTDASVTTPSGWTLVDSSLHSNRFRIGLYAKSASGSEDGTTVDFVTSATEKAAAQVYRITGWYGTISTGIEVSVASGSGETPNPGSLDPSNWATEETMWIAAFGTATQALTSVSAYPSSYSDGTLTQSGSAADTSHAHLASAYRDISASSENPGTFTKNGTAAKEWIAYTIGIRPQFAAQTIEAPLITNEPTFYGAELALQGLLIPPLIDLAVEPIAPSLAYEQLLLPDVLTNTPTFYGPTMGLIYTLTAPLITNAPTFYGVTIANTQIMVSPLITNTPTFYSPTIIGGSAAMVAPLISNSQTFYGPRVFTVWAGTDSLTSGTWTDTDIST